MRKLIAVLLLISPFAPQPVLAQANAIDVFCGNCRDPLQYPDDYVNFAFNQVYGERSWMDLDRADDFFIQNPDGYRVYVDIDFVMHGWRFFGIDLPIWPDNMLQITIALPNGLLYTSIRSVFMTPLPVPSSIAPESESPEPLPADENGGEGVDDPEGIDDLEDEIEPVDSFEWGPEGVTGIEDPDENGEFPDADWCEEC